MSGPKPSTGEVDAGRQVMDLLSRHLELCRRLEQLAEAQRGAIETDDPRPLLKLLTDRQKLTTALTTVNAELVPYRQRWGEVRQRIAAADRPAMERMLSESGERLRKILARDEADGRLLAAKKDRVARGMSDLQTGRRTLAAYGTASPPRPVALDGTEA